MKLDRLLNRQPVTAVEDHGDRHLAPAGGRSLPAGLLAGLTKAVEIGSIHYRAQEARPGGLFVAMAGQAADGHDYIRQALDRGAAAVVCQRPVAGGGLQLQVPDSRRALSRLAANFYGEPSRGVTLIGVTGTNGKTTVTYLLEQMLAGAGIETGVIGTVDYRYGGNGFDNPRTTPESADLQRIIADMQAAGVTHVIMEVASHGIALHRVTDCHLDLAVFTNLSQDHLDFHGDMAAYWDCKRRLFTELLPAGGKAHKSAVVNRDDDYGAGLYRELDTLEEIDALFGTGRTGQAQVRARDTAFDLAGIRGRLLLPGAAPAAFDSPLAGRHNLHNILSAAGAAVALGLSPEAIVAGIDTLAVVPGRLERVADPGGKYVYVDYAHTPDALDNVLGAVRELTTERVVGVFGCGGDRDRAKRPMMGACAARWSDLAVVTSDNPRSENPGAIIEEILPGVHRHLTQAFDPDDLRNGFTGRGYVVEPDRRRAIVLAVAAAAPGDAVVIAGKGHETYQEVKGSKLPFDDRQVAREILTASNRPAAGRAASPPDVWTAARLAEAGRGDLVCGDPRTAFGTVGIDSRAVQPGQVFVAIRGETHDGHRFAPDAVERGAGAVVIETDAVAGMPMDDWRRRGVTCVAVADTTRALGDLARYHRDRHDVTVVAITGSNGKTSTRRMTAGILSGHHRTLATRGNFNNAFGLPLTLLRLTARHRWAVVELGMNHPGEMRQLARICRPDIGVITNIGPVHLAFFESIEAIARAKAELLEEMPPGTTAVLNGRDDRRYDLARDFKGRVIHFGDDPNAAVRHGEVTATAGGVRFDLQLPAGTVPVALTTPAAYMAANASAAAAVAHLAGLSPKQIGEGLAGFRPVNGRMQTHTTAGGVTVVDDSYNANPVSMAAAIATLARVPGGGRRTLAAGDMLELGETGPELHRDIGRRAAEAGLDRLCLTGQFAAQVADGAVSAGMPPGAIFIGSRGDIAAHLLPWLRPGDWVVVKGSRSMGMEKVVDRLLGKGDR